MSDGKPETATEWSLRTWRERIERGYFPNSEQHRDWRIYKEMPPWFDRLAQPMDKDIVLEIGAGYGQWMIPLAPRVRTIIGVDIHERLADKVAEKFEEHVATTVRVLASGGRAVLQFRSPQHTEDGLSKPVADIGVNHTGDFSCGWTVDQIQDAAEVAGITAPSIHDLGLQTILVGGKG